MGVDMWVMPEISHHDEPWRSLRHSTDLYQGPREQALMAILADVTNDKERFPSSWSPPTEHNGTPIPGFWYRPDVGDHDPIVPIAEPRGVPLDASDTWKQHVANWEAQRERVICTYLSTEEILSGDWEQTVWRRGLLFEQDYIALREKGLIPVRWVGQAAGTKTLVVTEEQYAEGVRGEKETLVSARWNAGTINSVTHGFRDMIADLESMRPETSKMRMQILLEA